MKEMVDPRSGSKGEHRPRCPSCGTSVGSSLFDDEDERTTASGVAFEKQRFAFDLALDRTAIETDQALAEIQGHTTSIEDIARSFGGTLEEFSGRLDAGEANVKALIGTALEEARAARARTLELESKLAESSKKIEQLQHKLSEARMEASTDPLTGIANRGAFDRELVRAAGRAQLDGTPLSLLMIDIDHFKQFNDKFGHSVGDLVLKRLASVLVSIIKGRDLAARYGGEEFAIVLPNTKLPDAVSLAEIIRCGINAVQLGDKSRGQGYGRISVSLGVSLFRPGEDPESFISRSDAALYRAKRSGRNRVCCL